MAVWLNPSNRLRVAAVNGSFSRNNSQYGTFSQNITKKQQQQPTTTIMTIIIRYY
jgi:hypothetical protein